MPYLKRILFAALLLVFFTFPPVLAEDSAPAEPPPEKTAIVVDEEAGVIRFFIKGKEKALLDESGMHVRESVSYGGVLTDYGTAYFDDHAAKSKNEAGHAE